MTPVDVRRFFAIADAGGFSTFGRLSGPDELELAVAAYSLALEHVKATPENLLRVLIDEGVDHLPSAGKLATIVREAHNRAARRAGPPTPISTGATVPPSRGWLIARDAYVRQCRDAGKTPNPARIAKSEGLAARNVDAAAGLADLSGSTRPAAANRRRSA